MLISLVVAFGLLAPAGLLAAEPGPLDASAGVVKVYSAAAIPDHAEPWRPGKSVSYTGSGAVIEGGRVLTNAHVIEANTYVQVRPNGSPRKYPARVAFVSHTADLALLEVADPAFHEAVVPLPLGELPEVRDHVSALGFPNGGDTLSVTDGVVARVEHELYVQSWESLLSIQMDAAIAPGSSGGPVVLGGRLVGIAMQGFSGSAFGCAIPVPVVRQFLEDVEDGRYDGVPALRVSYQSLENPALKRSLGVPDEETGVVLTGAAAHSPLFEALEPNDVLTSVAGREIADDGTVELRERERTSLHYATDLHQVGDIITVRFLRNGEPHEAEATLGQARGRGKLVPRLFDKAGEYYAYGGLVFTTLTWNFVYSREWVPDHLREAVGRAPIQPNEQLVVVAGVLTGAVNRGYGDAWGEIVWAVNEEVAWNLSALVALVESADTPYVTFNCESGTQITLDRDQARQESPQLLERYGLTVDRSASLVRETEARRATRGPAEGPSSATPPGAGVASAASAAGEGGR